MDLSSLQALLAKVAGVRVACVGDLMLDRYVYGEVARISPEAPVPVLRRTREAAMLGGVGNVARNVTALGAKANLCGQLARDVAGEAVMALVREDSRLDAYLAWLEGTVTTEKTRFVAGGQQLLRVDAERVDLGDYGVLPTTVLAMQGAGAICVSDYAKGVVTSSLMAAALAAGEAAGVPVIVDPKDPDFGGYGPVDLLKPNAGELAAAVGLPVGSDGEIEAALACALERYPARAVLVTRAAAGMSLAQRDRPVRHFHGRAREVFDVSGAGDTSLAALGVALAAGATLEQAVELAVLASGVVVGKAGTAVVTPEDLLQAERADRPPTAPTGWVPGEHAAVLAAAWRREGLRVGFTNGCFDILHRGHVAYLDQARAWCDRLIVGLNTDAGVRALKGAGRPINDLESRASVLAGLRAVDLVTAFDTPTPLALIEAIRPDVLVKGADYSVEQVVGADFVRSIGGEVRLASLVEGHSTTAALARLKETGA